MNAEIEVAKWAGQAGGLGAVVYLLIRFGPLLEQLLTGRSRRDNMMTGPQGIAGANGIPGLNGTPGIAGRNGANGKSDDERVRMQMFEVMRTEKLLDQESHDRQCNSRQALVMAHIDSHTAALDKVGKNVDELLRRVKNGGG